MTYYKIAPECLGLKQVVEQKVVEFARSNYGFCYDTVFYDVTTLYFESFEEDELRKNGFSKNGKPHQPQIVIGLLVSQEGFPVSYQIFNGNTFEGHTIIPTIKQFVEQNQVKNFTVVADAAMISAENIRQLTLSNINYIVGARLGSLSASQLEELDRNLTREDGKHVRLKTDNGHLICSYPSARHRKDKREMDKQIEKAEQLVKNPSKAKRLKFTQANGQKIEINRPLVEKTKKLLGIKGYLTNLDESVASAQTVIERYHQLYKIEQNFRIAKNDLQTRPIFHFKEEPIKLHVLICFVALVLSKHIELKTGVSIRKFIDEAKKAADGEILNHVTQKKITIKSKPTPKFLKLIEALNSPH